MLFKKIGSTILAVATFAGLLTGCSSDSSITKESSQKEKLEIQYFVGGYGDDWWKDVIQDFKEQHPDLEIVEYAGPNVNTEMKSRWISNDPPDVVYIDGAGSSETQMVEDGQLLELTEFAQDIELEDGTKLLDNLIVEPNQYDGKIYSLPLVFDIWGIWYDDQLLDDAGLDAPKDFSSFMDTMKELKDSKGISPFVTTGQHPHYFLRGVITPAIAAEGGNELLAKIIKGEEGAWTSEPVMKVMKKVEAMQKAGFFDKGLGSLNHTQSQINFLNHKNVFIPVGLWLPREMENDIPENFKFGFTPTPLQDQGETLPVVPDLRPLAIAKEADNVEAAKEFVEFVFEKKYAEKFSEYTGAMINIKGVDLESNENIPTYLKEANALINDSTKVSLYQRPHPMIAELEKPISNALLSLLLGNSSAEEFVKQAEEAAKAYRNQ
ncbi:ABC transporter substrate-binding protein [Metabacillus fastidiosus]|uniref:ABC transporter substrate-binding protein n=1 Tax=Metabacillus fastidiosus TaxID=1458 RepID=UPI003D26CEA2